MWWIYISCVITAIVVVFTIAYIVDPTRNSESVRYRTRKKLYRVFVYFEDHNKNYDKWIDDKQLQLLKEKKARGECRFDITEYYIDSIT